MANESKIPKELPDQLLSDRDSEKIFETDEFVHDLKKSALLSKC